MEKSALVCGAGGFIGSHLVRRLIGEGYWVRGVDLKYPEFWPTMADEFIIGDLRDPRTVREVLNQSFDEVYQLAADMGGAGFVFTGNNDADILHNNALINLNVLEQARIREARRIFYASSACIYPQENQLDPANPKCSENSAYPANPDSDYGWEKLFSERLYLAFARNHDMEVRIARYHNIFGPYGTYEGGREKAPAAFCRKIARIQRDRGTIEMWGDGEQTRSFLYIDTCIDATRRLMKSNFRDPLNIGSEEMVTINQLAQIVAEIAGKIVDVQHIKGPLGVRGRNSDNRIIRTVLGWEPSTKLRDGLRPTYNWIEGQVK